MGSVGLGGFWKFKIPISDTRSKIVSKITVKWVLTLLICIAALGTIKTNIFGQERDKKALIVLDFLFNFLMTLYLGPPCVGNKHFEKKTNVLDFS